MFIKKLLQVSFPGLETTERTHRRMGFASNPSGHPRAGWHWDWTFSPAQCLAGYVRVLCDPRRNPRVSKEANIWTVQAANRIYGFPGNRKAAYVEQVVARNN